MCEKQIKSYTVIKSPLLFYYFFFFTIELLQKTFRKQQHKSFGLLLCFFMHFLEHWQSHLLVFHRRKSNGFGKTCIRWIKDERFSILEELFHTIPHHSNFSFYTEQKQGLTQLSHLQSSKPEIQHGSPARIWRTSKKHSHLLLLEVMS